MKRPSCAACKNQRRKCDDDCFIAPYFPAEKSRDFEAVHKHFGLHNVISILRSLPLQQRSDAVISLVYEANARVRDPVGGCTRIISALRQRINTLKAQLNFVKNQNAYYRTIKQQQLRQQNMVHNAGFVDFLRENNFPSSNQDFNLLHENLENPQQLQNPSSAQNQIAYHRTLKQQQLGQQNMFHNAGSVNFLQEHNNANLLPSPSQDFTFLNDNLENPQQLQESSSAQNQISHYRALKLQQLGQQNMVHQSGFVDFFQEHNNANLPQSPNQDLTFLNENLESPQQLQESSFAQESQLFGGDPLAISQGPSQQHQETGFGQGSYQSHGDSMTSLSIGSSKNVFGGDQQTSPSTIGQPVQRPLQKLQEIGFVQGSYQSHGDSATNQSIGASNNVFGGGQQTSLSNIGWPFQRLLHKHQGSFRFHGDSATNLSSEASRNVFGGPQRTSLSTIGRPVQRPLQQHQETGLVQGSDESQGDSVTNISIESSKNVLGGDENVEPERIKSSSPSSKVHGRKRPLEDSEAYLDLDLDSVQQHQETGLVQGSDQSQGDSVTNISIEASENVLGGGENVEPESIKSSSPSSKVHGWKRPLEDSEDYLDLELDSVTNISIEASENVLGGGENVEPESIKSSSPFSKVHGRKRPLEDSEDYLDLDLDSVTDISIEASENVLDGGEYVEPERIKSPSPSSKVYGRKRPLEDSEAYLDLDLDSVQQHQETGLVQGSDQSQGDSVTNISIEASENVLGGGENVEPESIKSSSPSSKVHGWKRPLEDSEDYLDLELDSVTNISIEASENVLGGGENVEPESIKSSSPFSKVHGRKRPLEDSEDYLDLDLDSVTDISIEASENVLDGGEYVEPERIKSPSPSSKVYGRKRPLEDCEDYLDLDLDLDDDDDIFRDST